MGRRVFLPAAVGPAAAYVIDRSWGRDLEAKARAMAGSQPEVSRQLLAAVAQFRESGRQWFEAEFEGNGSGLQAGSGSSEVPLTAPGPGLGGPPSSGLTTGEVATRLGRSDRQVRNLIRSGQLVATKEQGDWVIDEVSVLMEIERRRSDDRIPA